MNGPYNATMDANIANWPTVLRSAGKLKVKHVLPGHGLPANSDLIDGQAQFMAELHKAVKAGADQGKKLEELQASIQLPESVSTWVGNGLKGQIKDAYTEIAKPKM